MTDIQNLTVAQIRKIISVKEQIESLQAQLTSIFGGDVQAGQTEPQAPTPAKRKLSPAHRRKLIKALAKARKVRSEKAKAKGSAPAPKKRRLSAEARAAISAAAKARWASFRAAKAE